MLPRYDHQLRALHSQQQLLRIQFIQDTAFLSKGSADTKSLRRSFRSIIARVGRFDVIDEGIPAAERFKGVKRELAIRDFSRLGISHEFVRVHEKVDVKHIKTQDL
jgi:hypothetical protein